MLFRSEQQRRRIARTLAAITMVSFSPLAYPANMGNALDGMLVAVTDPSAYRSQSRMGAVGGSLTLRVPNKNIQLVTVDMPRLKMGCGAIDMFGGSFSFINADQLVAVLRNIGQIAVAALFKLAISSISPTLSGVMDTFSEVMHKLNNTRLNSCKIGSSIAADVFDAADGFGVEGAKQATKDLRQAQGISSSTLGSFNSWFSGVFDTTKVAPDPKNPHVANLVWRAIWLNSSHRSLSRPDSGIDSSLSEEALPPIQGLSAAHVARLIMGITGTRIIYADPDGKDIPCPADAASTVCDALKQSQPGNLLRIDDLIEGSQRYVLYEYNDEYDRTDKSDPKAEFLWQQMKSSTPTMSVHQILPGGTVALARQVLFGKMDQGEELSTTAKGGLICYITKCDPGNPWGNFDASPYLNAISAPLLRNLVTAQRRPDTIIQIGRLHGDLLAEDMAVHFATALANAATASFGGSVHGKVNQPKDFEANIERFRREIADYKAKASDRLTREASLAALVASVSGSLGSGSLTLKGGRR